MKPGGREKQVETWLPLAALGLGLAVVLMVGLHANGQKVIDLDESFSLRSTAGGVRDAFRWASDFELQPPGYFLTLALWRKLSPSIEFARALSTLFILGALWALHRTGRLLSQPRGQWLLLPLAAALSPQVLWAGSEARAYAMGIFLVAGTLYYFARIWLAPQPPGPGALVKYVLVSYLGILTLYYVGFVVAAELITAAAMGRGRRHAVAGALALALLLLPWVPTILHQVAGHPVLDPGGVLEGRSALGSGTLLHYLRVGVETVFGKTPLMLGTRATVLLSALALGLLGLRLTLGPTPGARPAGAFAGVTVLPFLVLLALRETQVVLVATRHLSITLPAAAVLAGIMVGGIGNRAARALALALWIGVMAAGTVSYYRSQRVLVDWRAVAALLTDKAAPGEPILVAGASGVLPLRYYLGTADSLYALPQESPEDRWVPDDLLEWNRDALALRLRALTEGRTSFWLVETRETEAKALGKAVGEYILANADTLDHVRLPGVDVARFLLRPQP